MGRPAAGPCLGGLQHELMHVPGSGWAAFGAQTAVQADILVFDHDPTGLQAVRDIQRLFGVHGRGAKSPAQIGFFSVVGKGDAIGGADVDAGIAFNALPSREHGLYVAI